MKKTFIYTFALFICLICAKPMFAQSKSETKDTKSDGEAKENVIKINPLSLFLGTFTGFYERTLTDKMSLNTCISLLHYSVGTSNDKVILSGFSLTPELRFYLNTQNSTIPKGVYAGPFLRYRNFSVEGKTTSISYDNNGNPYNTTNDNKVSINQIAIGGIAGYQYVAQSGFTLDVFGGPCYNSNSVKIESNGVSNNFSYNQLGGTGISFRFGIALGWAFN